MSKIVKQAVVKLYQQAKRIGQQPVAQLDQYIKPIGQQAVDQLVRRKLGIIY